MVFGLCRCYVASWDADPCLLRAAAEGSPEETELVAFDRLNTMRSTAPYVCGQDAWTVCLLGCGWVNWRRRRMDCDSGSDSGNGDSRDRRHSANRLASIPKGRTTQRLRSCQDSGAPCLACLARLPAWLGLPLTLPQPLDQTPLRPVKAGKLWAHVRQQHCQSARLANRASARSDSWVALAKAGCPSLGQGCRKSGLILMVKSPGFLHAFRDMSVWSVWLFSQRWLSVEQQRQQEQAAGSQLLPACSHFSCLGSSHMHTLSRRFPARVPVSLYCTTGLNHRISPFLTASNSVHPPIRRPVDVPSLPNHKPSIIQSSPIGAPRTHSLTNLSHPHTRLKQTH